MGRLDGKSVFITGAGSGIGRASALRCGAEGATVTIADIDRERAEATAAAVGAAGGEALGLQVDVTDEAAVSEAVGAAVARFGRLTNLVNCAGGSVAEDDEINLDLKGTFLTCRTAIPHIAAAGGGAIVNFTSVVALRGNFKGHVYTAAKGGIIALTQALAGRYWRDSIRANAIAPGVVLTERVRNRFGLGPEVPSDQAVQAALDANARLMDHRHPFGVGTPEDIANVVLFLSSDESRMVNGAVIPAEGGADAY
jgi:NAD(P)-dependent dehydrogenase (short-subunit alcohol dehydrogenase family)